MPPPTKIELAIRFLVALDNEGGEAKDIPDTLQPILEWCMQHGLVVWDWDHEAERMDPTIYRITEDGGNLANLFARVMELPEPEEEPEEEPPPAPMKPKPRQVEW